VWPPVGESGGRPLGDGGRGVFFFSRFLNEVGADFKGSRSSAARCSFASAPRPAAGDATSAPPDEPKLRPNNCVRGEPGRTSGKAGGSCLTGDSGLFALSRLRLKDDWPVLLDDSDEADESVKLDAAVLHDCEVPLVLADVLVDASGDVGSLGDHMPSRLRLDVGGTTLPGCAKAGGGLLLLLVSGDPLSGKCPGESGVAGGGEDDSAISGSHFVIMSSSMRLLTGLER
jgi:hypothetical protein